jgi:hypothetical protein
MKRLIVCVSAFATTMVFAETPMMSPPERRIYVTSIGDVLEWQPGLGFVVVSGRKVHTRTVTQVSKRRVRADGKSVVELERPFRTQRSLEIETRERDPRPEAGLEAPRPRPSAKDEGESLMEEIEPVAPVPR